MNLNNKYPEFNERLAEALGNVGDLKGVIPSITISEGLEDELVITGAYLDNYLLAGYLSQLIKSGCVELKFNPDKYDKAEYLLRLLGLKKRGEKLR